MDDYLVSAGGTPNVTMKSVAMCQDTTGAPSGSSVGARAMAVT